MLFTNVTSIKKKVNELGKGNTGEAVYLKYDDKRFVFFLLYSKVMRPERRSKKEAQSWQEKWEVKKAETGNSKSLD